MPCTESINVIFYGVQYNVTVRDVGWSAFGRKFGITSGKKELGYERISVAYGRMGRGGRIVNSRV
jgi:hypothetical protein